MTFCDAVQATWWPEYLGRCQRLRQTLIRRAWSNVGRALEHLA
jgi:hypothetical protein